MKPRLKDIAEKLGISVVTVSKALQDYKDVSPRTRAKVRAVAKELNYQPNWAARSLVKQRSFTIGMVLPHLRHTFFQEAYEAILKELAPKGYTVLIGVSFEDPETERREIDQMIARQVDGLIVASTRTFSEGSSFSKLPIPFILLDRCFEGVDADFVGVDDRAIGELATRHLLDQGCGRIGHLRGPEASTAIDRLAGYRSVLRDAGKRFSRELVQGDQGSDAAGYDGMRKLLELPRRPDGVFCYNDPVAVGALRAVLEAGCRAPEDIALIGVGDMRNLDMFRVPLSTVDQGSAETGVNVANLLLKRIESRGPAAPASILTRPRLIVRESSRRR